VPLGTATTDVVDAVVRACQNISVSSPCFKRDASPGLVESVRRIEKQADACHDSLAILGIPSNVALWGLLTGSVSVLEELAARHGDQSKAFSVALDNVSRFAPIAMKWVVEYGKPPSSLAQRRWIALTMKSERALSVADKYSAFCACLPMWHKNRLAAEVASETLVRFTALGSGRDRQVMAHLSGFRPGTGRWKGESAKKVEPTHHMRDLFASVLETSRKTGSSRFAYSDPWALWRELLAEYQAQVAGITRRPDSLSLGPYTLGHFKQFYAALLAVCAAHEFLCFQWAQKFGAFPFDSAVLIRSLPNWVDALSTLSGVSHDECKAIMRDLTFDFARSLDLHVHPFLPLDHSTMRVALAPQFPLHSLPDENILRVCSNVRPSSFDATSIEKEPEMIAALQEVISTFQLQGPVPLPNPIPDIDFIVSDELSSTVVFAETKWVRKTSRPVEFQDRDAEVRKGISQLEKIREFLACNPGHLRSQGKLPRKVSEYERVYYLVVARDHWLWVEPTEDSAIVEFDAFSTALGRSGSLRAAVEDLLKYDWLPVEGRDFSVQFDRAMTNGVAIEFEAFYAPVGSGG